MGNAMFIVWRESVEAIVVFAAAGLITHMVLWMRSHGKSPKSDLEAGLWGVAVLAALAMGREGAETVIFLYGLGLESHGAELGQFIAAAVAGFALGLATGWRAQPSLAPMLALAAYWLAVAAAFHAPRRLPNRTGAAA